MAGRRLNEMTSAFFKKWVRVARTRLSGTSDNFADLILTTRAHHNVVGNDSRAGAPRATCWRLVAGGGGRSRPCLSLSRSRSELEYGSVVGIARTTVVCGAVEVSGFVEEQTCFRQHALPGCSEAVQYRGFAGAIQHEHGSEVRGRAALGGGAVQIARGIADQRRGRISSVGVALEVV